MKESYSKISEKLYIVEIKNENENIQKEKFVPTKTNHIAVIDCSGSMSGDLPELREHLKQKLPSLINEGDTFSIIWFSGKSQFGSLFEGVKIQNVVDLEECKKNIDKWLVPIGMTGFKEPIDYLNNVLDKLAKQNQNANSLFFMSDGCDNQWPRNKILESLEKVAPRLQSTTFVEYGFYADRNLLSNMAEKTGGSLIFSDNFNKFVPIFEKAMHKKLFKQNRIDLKINGDIVGGFAFSLDEENTLSTFEYKEGKINIPENFVSFYYLSSNPVGVEKTNIETVSALQASNSAPDNIEMLKASYFAMSLFAVRMKPDIIFKILKATGDVKFIREFTNCFGKQKYTDFMENVKNAGLLNNNSVKARMFEEGRNPNIVPEEDAFTVLDLLQVLTQDKRNKILLDSKEFKYSRVSRKRVDADENFSTQERKQIAEITEKMKNEQNALKIKELQNQLNEITSKKTEALEFVVTENPDGYPINGLVLNETQPNISFNITQKGTIDISKRLQNADPEIKNELKNNILNSSRFRSFTIIKDGLVNIEKLPMHLTRETLDVLKMHKVPMIVRESNGAYFTANGSYSNGIDNIGVLIHVNELPVINRKMIKEITAKNFLETEWELVRSRCYQKVFNHYNKEMNEKSSTHDTKVIYSAPTAKWMMNLGFNDDGFNPRMVQAPHTDVYNAKSMETKFKGYTSIPSYNEVIKRIESGKELTGCAAIMGEAIEEVELFFKNNPKNLHSKWIEGKKESYTAQTRGLIYQMAKMKFSIILGQIWFPEFKSIEENSMEIEVKLYPTIVDKNGNKTKTEKNVKIMGTILLEEVEVKI